jgi:3-phosphoshikimate 1-carboxyvinyltransferase
VPVSVRGADAQIRGVGSEGLVAPDSPLECGRSGSTMRLLAGLLAGARFPVTLTGHPQLLARPMERVAEPLRLMGATVELAGKDRAPITVTGGKLRGIEYRLPVASAQVKSAVLLAGLRAEGRTTVVEPQPTRDHTERLLRAMGARCEQGVESGQDGSATHPARWERSASVWASELHAIRLRVPGDLSSAAPILAAAALIPGSEVGFDDVGLNPTRMGFAWLLRRMGARVEVEPKGEHPEPWGSLMVGHRPLRGLIIEPEQVPGVIDELPLLALVGTQAEGLTKVTGAGDLRVKESDRIAGVVTGLRALGADIEELDDGFVVRGPTPLEGGVCDARDDHRLAMAFSVAGMIARDRITVTGLESMADSFPGFLDALRTA